MRKGASDLHLSVGLPPMIRLNGHLEKLGETKLKSTDIVAMLEAAIPDGRAKSAFERGEIDLGIEIDGIGRLRTNIYHDNNGICAAFRLIPNQIYSLEELGLPKGVDRIRYMRKGLILVTGSAGSGKSTTLASIIDRINFERQGHIITIEDPIEFVHKHKKCIVNQREIGMHTGSLSSALRAALREDPDIIFVGEMRDLDTMAMAITAAETGHLVLSTLHTKGAAQTVDRVIDVFPPYQQEQIRVQLADTLEMVISQVLVPSIDGKKRYLSCEVMVTTPSIRNLIRGKKTYQIKSMIETGTKFGMQTLEESLKFLVEAGKISRVSASQWVSDKNLFAIY